MMFLRDDCTAMPTTSLLTNLIIPLNLCLTFLVLGLLVGLLRWRKTGMAIAAFGAAWLLAWSLPVTSLWLGGTLETVYPPPDPARAPTADAIVVLGGNTANARANWFEPLDKSTIMTRVDTAAALFHARRAPKVVLSGGALEGDVSEAQGMAAAIRQLGVPESALILENASRSTYENALLSAEEIDRHDLRTVLVVTSAVHMPRAMATFRKQGVQAYAAAVPRQIVLPDDGSVSPWIPNQRALDASRSIIKEYAAIGLYWARGWL